METKIMPVIKVVLLDFDGVIVESNNEKTGAFKELFALYPKHTQAMLDYHITHQSSPRMVKFRHYAAHFLNLSDSDAEKETKIMASRFSELVKNRVIECPLVPGAERFLKTFAGHLPLYVSSNTPQSELVDIIQARRLDSYFKKIFGNPPISKKEAIQAVLRSEGISPENAIFIGDAMSDYQAASDIGLEFIGRDSGLPFDAIDAPVFNNMHAICEALLKMIGA